MRSRLLAAVGAIAISGCLLLADNARETLRVSVTVTRSCRVSTDATPLSVDCGKRPHPVQVVSPSPAPQPSTTTDAQTLRPVTIEF